MAEHQVIVNLNFGRGELLVQQGEFRCIKIIPHCDLIGLARDLRLLSGAVVVATRPNPCILPQGTGAREVTAPDLIPFDLMQIEAGVIGRI